MQPIDGLVAVASKFSVTEAIARLEAAVHARGLTVFSHFDHAANARAADLEMRPATVVWFGDARMGTKLMQTAPTIAIELPHRALVYADAGGQTWVAYNDPSWLAHRHGIAVDAPILAVTHALAALVKEAAGDVAS